MRIRYTGDNAILLSHDGGVYDVKPGDELELDSVPDARGFEVVKETKTKEDNK